MRICFWGVRGSLPSPETPSRERAKIAAILERLGADDLVSAESRKRFLEALPPWLSGTVGGNTSCVGVRNADSAEWIIFDAGSGIRELGRAAALENPRPSRYHLFLSHFHWDHLQGFPFFGPAYDPSVSLELYSPLPALKTAFESQMRGPYFPVGMEAMASQKNFNLMEGPVELGGVRISCRKMVHPGDSYAFLVNDGKRRFLYATDTELSDADFLKTEENTRFFGGADLAVIDAQYTLGEAIDKISWGHNSFSLAVDFAASWGIKHLVLFHHEPAYDDEKLYNILQSARKYRETMNFTGIEISLAEEGLEIAL